MEKTQVAIIFGVLAVLCAIFAFAVSTDPAKFGDGTTTTAWIGGALGNGTFTGNVSYSAARVTGTRVVANYTTNGCYQIANSTGLYWIC